MLVTLKRIRETVTWVVLAIICAWLVLGVVRLSLLLFKEQAPLFAAFQEIGLSIMNLSLVIALVGLVCACLFVPPATPRAVLLARLSAWVLAIGTLLQLVCLLLGVAASHNAFGVIMEILGGLLDIVLKAVAAGVLWVLVRGVRSGRLDLPRPNRRPRSRTRRPRRWCGVRNRPPARPGAPLGTRPAVPVPMWAPSPTPSARAAQNSTPPGLTKWNDRHVISLM